MATEVSGGATGYHDVSTTQELLDDWPDVEQRDDLEELETTRRGRKWSTLEGKKSSSPTTVR